MAGPGDKGSWRNDEMTVKKIKPKKMKSDILKSLKRLRNWHSECCKNSCDRPKHWDECLVEKKEINLAFKAVKAI